MIATQPGRDTKHTDDAQTRFDMDLKRINAQSRAYEACAIREAQRLETSGERADLVALAAARACNQQGDTTAVPGIIKEQARQKAEVTVIEVRARRAQSGARP